MMKLQALINEIKFTLKGFKTFLLETIRNPSAVGAACPSSKKLAEMIAQQIPKDFDGQVIELGAGTGVVTEAILQRDILPDRLYVIERAKKLCEHLQERFPELHIIHGDAANLGQLLTGQLGAHKIVISGLPFRTLPKAVAGKIESEVVQLLNPGELFIQFTYDIRKRSTHHFKNLQYKFSRHVWFNIPPARVDVYTIT